MQEFTATKSDSGTRTDVFVASKYPDFTRSAMVLLFDTGFIKINGNPVRASRKLHIGDKITVDESFLRREPPNITLPVIYEDDDLTVIDKPSGVLTHAKGALNLEGTVASFIKNKLADGQMSGNRAGIVHRLDRATSGVIITAKTALASSKLQKQFSLRKAKKSYIAVVEGRLKPEAAIIDAPIMRNPTKPQTFKVGHLGKEAITEYETVKTFEKNGKYFTLVTLKPKTGRTHQLRVHMSYIGHPVVGDSVYGNGDGNLLLHALTLEITTPRSERKIFQAPVPHRITEFVDV